MGLGPSLRKLLNKYGEENIYEIITAFGHRIYLKDNRKLTTDFPDNEKREGDYVFNDELGVLEINLVISGENKRYFFSYESIEVVSFDNKENPIYDFDKLFSKSDERAISITETSVQVSATEDNKDLYTFKFKGVSNFELKNDTWHYFNVIFKEDPTLKFGRNIDTFDCSPIKEQEGKYEFNLTTLVELDNPSEKPTPMFVQFYRNGEPINSKDIVKDSIVEQAVDPLTIPIKLT